MRRPATPNRSQRFRVTPIRMSRELLFRMKQAQTATGCRRSEIVRRAVVEWLERHAAQNTRES
ncbi:MAG TPA: hypothetical protein VMY40_14895 [Anaerolineae bacterium]|nr:hypothetical protein [Anaerolineae bacterium]